MFFTDRNEPSEKTGYLNEAFRLFHLRDQASREFSWHYHDFHKVVIFLSGKATYHIEGRSYPLKPWDILLFPMNASSSGSRMIFPIRNCSVASRRPETAATTLSA